MTCHWGIERDLKSESLEKTMIKSQKTFQLHFYNQRSCQKIYCRYISKCKLTHTFDRARDKHKKMPTGRRKNLNIALITITYGHSSINFACMHFLETFGPIYP